MAKKKNAQHVQAAILRKKALAALDLLVPEWASQQVLQWDRVAQLVGSDTLTQANILDHRKDCTHLVAGMDKVDVLRIGEITAGGGGSTRKILARYLGPVKRSEIAAELRCPLYFLGDELVVSHEHYHKILDAFANREEWDRALREMKKERRDLASVRKEANSALANLAMGYEKARTGLGLTGWQMDQAFAAGILTAGLASHGVLVGEYEAAMADLDAFKARVSREDKIHAGQIATLLGVVHAHVDEIIAEDTLRACGEGSFKWGVFALYRRGDVEDLLEEMPLRVEERRIGQMARRITAGKAAAERRKR